MSQPSHGDLQSLGSAPSPLAVILSWVCFSNTEIKIILYLQKAFELSNPTSTLIPLSLHYFFLSFVIFAFVGTFLG